MWILAMSVFLLFILVLVLWSVLAKELKAIETKIDALLEFVPGPMLVAYRDRMHEESQWNERIDAFEMSPEKRAEAEAMNPD